MNRLVFTRRPGTRLAVGALVLMLAGCAVGPDYRRPEAALPGAFNSAALTAAPDAAVPLEREWWRLFQDEALNALVASALVANQDLQAAVARMEEAEGLVREAGAVFFPQIDASAGASRSQVSTVNAMPVPSTVPRLQDSRRAALGTSFEIDLWGKLRRAHQAARAELLASRYARDTVELSLAGAVVSSYLALRAADASLALTRDSLDSRREALGIVNSRRQAGSASPLDQHQAESALALIDAQLAELRRQRALAENQLGLLTGQPGLRIAADDLRRLPVPPVPPTGLPSALLEARPDLRQAEERLVSANAQIGVAKAALFPSVSLTGRYGSESAALSKLFTGPAGVWSLGLAASMPIFDAGRNLARIDQASARQKQALAAYQKAVQTAFKEVNDALVGLRENSEGEQAQERRALAARKTLALAQLRYEAGYSPFLEVLDAQRSANDASLAWVGMRQLRLGSVIDLFKALGGGWKDGFKADSLKNSGDEESLAEAVKAP